MIDHSVQVDAFGNDARLRDQRRARVRAQRRALRVPALGPAGVRQLPRRAARRPASATRSTSSTSARSCSRTSGDGRHAAAYPDTLVGTDSHTTMINGLGVLGWGVGGIEAEAAMLGQPISMLLPQVVGFRLTGELPEGATATDLVLTVTEMLREHGVVGKFVEFFGAGLSASGSPTARRSATCRRSSARPARSSPSTPRRCATSSSPGAPDRADRAGGRLLPRAGAVPRPTDSEEPTFTDTLELDLSDGRAEHRRPKAAPGPRRRSPTPRRPSSSALAEFDSDAVEALLSPLDEAVAETFPASDPVGRGPRQRREQAAAMGAAGGRGDRGRGPARRRADGDARGRHRGRARPRPRRDRRDHELHQHVEPVGDGRRRAARAEGRRARARVASRG